MFCTKCGNQMPNDAKFCDKCGATTSSSEVAATVNNSTAHPPKKSNSLPMLRKLSWYVWVIAALISLFSLFSFISSNSTIQVVPQQIAKEYRENITKADTKYKDKTIVVTGKVVYKGQFDNTGGIFVQLETPYEYENVDLLIDFSNSKDLSKIINNIKADDFIKVKGECIGNVKQDDPNRISIHIQGKSIEN